MSKDELLKYLDMNEDERVDWLWNRDILKPNESLADLAFRLRDEVVKESHRAFHDAVYEVMEYCGDDSWASAYWGMALAKPIHWIIAALIAKEKS
jgi:hypothetical protein